VFASNVEADSRCQWESMPDKIERYRAQAAKYISMAEESSDMAQKGKLIDMAETWLRLAEQSEQIRLQGKHHLDV
jgi:hypothetical protein